MQALSKLHMVDFILYPGLACTISLKALAVLNIAAVNQWLYFFVLLATGVAALFKIEEAYHKRKQRKKNHKQDRV
jgi:hypothetical protein